MFLRRMDIDPADVRLLVKAGCFDVLEGKVRRPSLQWELLRHHHGAERNGMLFEELADDLPSPAAYDDRSMLRQELETLGMLVSCHPLLLYRRIIARLKPVRADQMDSGSGVTSRWSAGG